MRIKQFLYENATRSRSFLRNKVVMLNSSWWCTVISTSKTYKCYYLSFCGMTMSFSARLDSRNVMRNRLSLVRGSEITKRNHLGPLCVQATSANQSIRLHNSVDLCRTPFPALNQIQRTRQSLVVFVVQSFSYSSGTILSRHCQFLRIVRSSGTGCRVSPNL